MTVYWVVWDAAAQWIVDRLDREGALPALRRLRAHGVRAGARPPRPNCQTPPALATLFTGARAQRHGITGFLMPSGAGVAEHRSGFAEPLTGCPPVWEALAARGMRGAFVHAPWVFGPDGGVGRYVDAAIEAYSGRVTRHDALDVTPGEEYRWSVGGNAVDVLCGPDELRLTTAAGEVCPLAASAGWVSLRVGQDLGCWVRYFVGSGQRALLRTGVWRVRTAGSDGSLVAALRDAAVFAGEGLGSLYRVGRFGPRLAEGGDGAAERAFLSSVECVTASFRSAAETVLHGHHADLVVVYLPMTDDVGHELIGWCDERSASYRPDIADQVWRHIQRCYRWSDDILGLVLDRAGPDDTVVLSADHGMVGFTHFVHLNQRLVDAGLAARSARGGLDPPRSAVVYHPANNGSLWVNHDGLPGGVVPTDQVAGTLRRAMEVLTGIADPVGGGSVVTGFLGEDGRPLPPDGDAAVAYVVLADDYQPSAALADDGALLRPGVKTGMHVVNTGSDRLHATFAAAGPGIPGNHDLGVVDNTMVAELVLRGLAADPRTSPLPLAISGS